MAAGVKTDAWMPLWIGSYLADTQHLERGEHGAYFLLMMAYWRNQGPLPDDDKRLSAITKSTPKEWKVLRQTMAEFFKVADGVWWHKRIEVELAGSKARSEKAASKAKAGAQARWGHDQNDAPSNATSIPQASPNHAPSNAQALPDDVPKQCPTPSPLPITSKEVSLSHSLRPDASDPDFENPGGTTPAGEVCKALRRIGLASVSPSHPELAALLGKGVSLEMFEDAATKTVAKQKGFAYMLAIIKAQLVDAATIAAGPSVGAEAWNATRQSIEAHGVRCGLGLWCGNPVQELFSAYTERVRMALESTHETAGA